MRKGLVLLAAAIAVFTFVAFGAQAMPASSLKGANKSSGNITLVAGNCGRGWHRGPNGGCRRN
jgi:Spy/CpxP family protein refolding chaperone